MAVEDNSLIIKRARSHDYLSICSLLDENNLPHEDIRMEYLNNYFITRKGDKVIGVIGLEIFDQIALLRSLVVKKEFRGLDLGIKLVSKAEQYAFRKNVKEIYLLTTTADRFFYKFGYSTIDREKVPDAIRATMEFQRLCPSSALIMVKKFLHE